MMVGVGKELFHTPPPKHNDKERETWIMNDEGLYRWAKSEGVPV